jgi:hypothetical protein
MGLAATVLSPACAGVNFVPGNNLVELYTYSVDQFMKKTPDPTPDLNYKHSDLLRGISAKSAEKAALKRGVSLAESCKQLIIRNVAAALRKYGPKRWLQDTGAGHDLISRADVDPQSQSEETRPTAVSSDRKRPNRNRF